ncbi:XdhC/CoxI family protein [Granulicella sp. 5B5]|uniref:XdhC family protein n=1 Tax=Granulicella sp. 5B5 TaxID=1617967 RepID=UPI0015F3FE2A|nr:XdhC/CoxI family protein [Granulicella sp. 5B5]QMV18296.1 XdhC/CoxI family protein [Granulicella sp. 5B5]
MQERRKLLERWRQGGARALVTLVQVEGSSYRQAGARMLVCADSEYVGGISGGCLEAEVLRRAAWKVRSGAVVERFSTLFDDTEEMPYGLGCGGTLYLLLEPTDTPEFDALMEAMEASLRGEACEVVTVLPQAGLPLRRVVRDAEGCLVFGEADDADAPTEAVFHEVLEPPQRLLLCGAGNDAQPMVSFSAQLGWSVTVLDGRAQWARAERFPEAERVVAATSLEGVEVGERDAVVLMTHSYEQDRDWLTAVLPRRPRYLGLLGARHRSALLLSEAAALLGLDISHVCEHVFAPVGLDLGGDGAEAIALATIAEIQACCQGKLGHSQRMTPEMIAEQIAKGGASRYLEAQCAL